jgi:quinol monooxygenase YgiN
MTMEMTTIARFHAKPGKEEAVLAAIREGQIGSRKEPGCLSHEFYRGIRDPQLFYIVSRWKDQAAFEIHAELPHTVKFIETVEPLIDHPLDVNRTQRDTSGDPK